MSYHYKADGSLDMRYSSSKSYVSSGGSIFGPCGGSSLYRSSNYGSSSNYGGSSYSSSSNNNLHYRKDGNLDMRYSSSKNYNSSNTSSQTSSNISTPLYSTQQRQVKTESSVPTPKQSLYTEDDIILNQDGTINRTSKAVRSNEILFTQDGKVDKRCSAFRNGKILLDSEGNIDSEKMGLKIRMNPGDMSTKTLRHPYEQQKYREKSRSTQKDQKQACHKIDLDVARELLSTKPGTHLSEERLHEEMKPLNELLRMRNIETNLVYDKEMARQIIELYRGERTVAVSRALSNKIMQMKDAIDSIPSEKMNGSLNWIKRELDEVSKKC